MLTPGPASWLWLDRPHDRASDSFRAHQARMALVEASISASAASGNRTMEIDYGTHGWWGTFAYFVPNSDIANKIVNYVDSLQTIHNFDTQMAFQGKHSWQSDLPNDASLFKYLATPAQCYMDDKNESATYGKLVGSSINHIYTKKS